MIVSWEQDRISGIMQDPPGILVIIVMKQTQQLSTTMPPSTGMERPMIRQRLFFQAPKSNFMVLPPLGMELAQYQLIEELKQMLISTMSIDLVMYSCGQVH